MVKGRGELHGGWCVHMCACAFVFVCVGECIWKHATKINNSVSKKDVCTRERRG